MNKHQRFKLQGNYHTPRFKLGDVVMDELRGEVKIVGLSNGRIPWPLGKRMELVGQHASPVLFGGLARRVGAQLNVHDAMSPANRHVVLERLDKFDRDGEWKEVLDEDRHAGPAETAAARIDVAKWFRSLPLSKRKVARALTRGESTKATAEQFGISPARISQLRRELHQSWQELQGEPVAA